MSYYSDFEEKRKQQSPAAYAISPEDAGQSMQPPTLQLKKDDEAKTQQAPKSKAFTKDNSLNTSSYVPDDPDLKKKSEKEETLLLFVGGLRMWKRNRDQLGHKKSGKRGGLAGIYEDDKFDYWSEDENSFGESVDMAAEFREKFDVDEEDDYFLSGSSKWRSSAEDRMEEGKTKAELFHKMVQAGKITIDEGQTITMVSHSQGGAHSAGFAEQLLTYVDDKGKPIYNVARIYYITPHQPKDIDHPDNVKGYQYSHPNDAISSKAPWWLPNGGSEIGKIPDVADENYLENDIMGGKGQPKAEGPAGNRGGHNVWDNNFIFNIPEGQKGHIKPLKKKKKK